MKEFSNSQVDRLGDRLRSGKITDKDLEMLDAYRRSFTPSYEVVVGAVRQQLGLMPTGRPAKSTTSIGDKLRRESIRLSQIQDIAGCRVVVNDVLAQDAAVRLLTEIFPAASVYDRRETPSNGYRAVHVVVPEGGHAVEVQIRTSLEHSWAELSEKLSDVVAPDLKYGGGPESIRDALRIFSDLIGQTESVERDLLLVERDSTDQERITSVSKRFLENKQRIADLLKQAIASL